MSNTKICDYTQFLTGGNTVQTGMTNTPEGKVVAYIQIVTQDHAASGPVIDPEVAYLDEQDVVQLMGRFSELRSALRAGGK